MKTKTILLSVGVVLIAGVLIAGTQVTILVVDLSGAQKTLLVKRPNSDIRFLDSPKAICIRKRLGQSSAFQSDLEKSGCEWGVAAAAVSDESNIFARLPYNSTLHSMTFR